MDLEEKDTQTSEETQEKKETSQETGTEEKEVDYKTKFVESSKEALRLKTELDNLKVQKPTEVPEDEKKIRETISKLEIEKEEKAKQDEVQLRKDLEDLHTIYGDFDEKKLLSVVDRYGVYDEKESVNWYAAMELYEKIGEVPAEPVKPKTLQSKREGAVPQAEVEAPVDVSKKSLPDLVREGLNKFGL
jgi:hypothetical protein